jgi:excisionase family DNA binding protein
MPAPLALTPEDAAATLAISRRQLYRLIGAGKIKARKAGTRTTLIDAASVKAYYDALPGISGASIPNSPQVLRTAGQNNQPAPAKVKRVRS